MIEIISKQGGARQVIFRTKLRKMITKRKTKDGIKESIVCTYSLPDDLKSYLGLEDQLHYSRDGAKVIINRGGVGRGYKIGEDNLVRLPGKLFNVDDERCVEFVVDLNRSLFVPYVFVRVV